VLLRRRLRHLGQPSDRALASARDTRHEHEHQRVSSAPPVDEGEGRDPTLSMPPVIATPLSICESRVSESLISFLMPSVICAHTRHVNTQPTTKKVSTKF
jgi:hypothetical protein